jgi:pimeloyl-ACP methyl ester carboxylesterase
MVKKTLLSLAIAASTAGLTACNISSTADNNEVATDPVNAGQPGHQAEFTAVVFSAGRGELPLNTDFLFASASATDGTASITDTSSVTNMINDLAGFSATATIDLAFTAALDPATVIAGSSVWLVELKSKEDNSLIDSLDLASIVAVAPANPFADDEDQLAPGPEKDYVAEYVAMDNGATPTIRIHPLKPLDPKTKYIVIVTDKLKDANGKTVVSSSEYAHTTSNEDLISPSLAPVRTAVQGWEQLAGGFLANITLGAQTQDNVILSYAFTTEANTDILLAMAAPENYIYGLFADTVGLEGAVGEETVATAIATVGTILGMPFATDAEKLAVRNTATYKTSLANGVAESLVIVGAGQAGLDFLTSQVALGVLGGPADTEAKMLQVKTSELYATTVQNSAANGAGALLKDAAHRPSAQDFVAIPVAIPHTTFGLPNPFASSTQGMLTLPQFMKTKSLADPEDLSSLSDFWKANTDVGDVIDGAFGNDEGSTPPKDTDNSLNVTYRFPFAQHIEDVKVPVLITYPTAGGGCTKPVDGWKTIIFQHGITTDRTASIGFANSMSAAATGCFATVAMDLPTHGVDAASTDRNGAAKRYSLFDAFNVAGYAIGDGSTTPFASTIAAMAPTFSGLGERHNNLALDATQSPVPMNFTPDTDNGNTGTGNSGDFFINLTNMQQTRDHIRQAAMDMMNLTASIAGMDIDTGGAGDLDENNLYFVGHSLGAITGLTSVAVNNAVANNSAITVKEVKPFKAAVLANPGGQLPKLLENSPSFSASILPGLAASGLTQGMSDLEKFYAVFQGPLDSADPVNFTELLKSTNTPVLMFEMVGGGLVNESDSNTDSGLGKVTGLPDTLITAGGYPADTVVPNNANPALNSVATGLSYLTGTDPLIKQLELTTVTGSIADTDVNLMVVSKLKEGTHGTISSVDAATVFAEMIGQTASFFTTDGQSLAVGDADQLQVPAAE